MESNDEDERSCSVIKLPKALDSSTTSDFENSLSEVSIAAGRAVVLDMTCTEFVSSAGIRLLILAADRCNKAGSVLRLAGLTSNVAYTLKICGLLSHFSVFDTIEEASRSL